MKRILFTEQDIERTLNRIAHEIWEQTAGTDDLVMIGIRRRGVTIARRLADRLERLTGASFPVGAIDITLYRDDLSEIASQPVLKKTEIPFPIKNTHIILCDDVLYSGRTVRAALDGIIDMGRPRTIKLSVLIDRGHRELPIQPNYVGKRITTTRDELVEVLLKEDDGSDQIMIIEGPLNGNAQ